MAKEFTLKALLIGVDKLSPTLNKARENAIGFRKKLLKSGLGKPISLSTIMRGGAFAAPFVAGAKAAIDFESSMADVRKVVDFETPQQFAEMGKDILAMSSRLPMAARDIATIVAAGGQSGLARQELSKFAEDAVKMGVAFDQTADEAGGTMAKWRAAFKMDQDEVVQLADQINQLGNSGAASAGQIARVVTAIGPLAEVAGVSSAELAALGSTLAGVGVDESVAATGLRNFFTTLNAGASATKAQQNVFKALRMDPKTIASQMTTDAKGTMLHVLKAISKVDKSKQVAVMKQLFGNSGMNAVAPMLTSLETLERNMQLVGDSTQYAGSMEKEYQSRSATTANALQLMRNRVEALGVTVGSILLPPINSTLAVIGPLIESFARFIGDNPALIKSIIGMAVGYGALRVATVGLANATKIYAAVMKFASTVTSASPIGFIVRAIALGAGLIIANWGTIGPWFKDLWEGIKQTAQATWDWLKDVFFNWNPLGIIIKNWDPIVAWFKDMWARVKKFIDPIIKGIDKVKSITGGISDTVSNAAGAAKETVTGAVSGAYSWAKGALGLGDSAPAAAPIGNQKTEMNGQIDINVNADGMTTATMKTDQPGMKTKTKQNTGIRTLAGAY